MYHAHPIVLFHIFAAILGLLSGYMAMFFRKGSGLHGAAGTIFFVSMTGMSLSGAYGGAFIKPIMLNVVAGLLTFYLVVTAWRAGRRRESAPDGFDRAAIVYVAIVAVVALGFGMFKPGSMPRVPYFVFGIGALLAFKNDVKMFRRGGLYGGDRIRRHLWRMTTALWIATLSFYPGQAKLFPQWLKNTNLLLLPHLFLLGALIFYGFKMRARRTQRVQPTPVAGGQITGGVSWTA